MELKEFISNTIAQITDGILEGDKYVKEKTGGTEGVRSQYTEVNFDVAVSTHDEEKNELGGKISVVQLFNVGGSSTESNKNSNHNRIQFEILVNVETGGKKYSVR
jgi:hypothetical protein